MDEPQGLTRCPTGWFRSADSRRDRDTLSPMDTHAAVRMLTAAGADETLAVAVVDVAQNAAADQGRELSPRSDLDHLREVQRADLATLETLRGPADVAFRRCDAGADAPDPRRRGRDPAPPGLTPTD